MFHYEICGHYLRFKNKYFIFLSFSNITEADLDHPMTQLTTTRPPLLTAWSMKEVVVGKYLRSSWLIFVTP